MQIKKIYQNKISKLLVMNTCSVLSTSSNKTKSCLNKQQVKDIVKLYNKCSIDDKCYSNLKNKKIKYGTKSDMLKSLKKNLNIND